MKLLAIGNSFSDDATAYLNQIAASDGVEIRAVNLYQGGCSLLRHADNYKNDRAAYTYELNGVMTDRSVSIREALDEDTYDVITVQQVSTFSGFYDTYFPHITLLTDAVRQAQSGARLLFHQTWVYEYNFASADFDKYDRDQKKMHSMIYETSYRVASELGLDMIKNGEVMWALRSTPVFDAKNGGISLSRDGLHLDYTYGRLAAALSYYTVLTGNDPRKNSFMPHGAKEEYAQMIREIVYTVHSRV